MSLGKALIFLRDMSFAEQIPEAFRESFVSKKHANLIQALRGLARKKEETRGNTDFSFLFFFSLWNS